MDDAFAAAKRFTEAMAKSTLLAQQCANTRDFARVDPLGACAIHVPELPDPGTPIPLDGECQRAVFGVYDRGGRFVASVKVEKRPTWRAVEFGSDSIAEGAFAEIARLGPSPDTAFYLLSSPTLSVHFLAVRRAVGTQIYALEDYPRFALRQRVSVSLEALQSNLFRVHSQELLRGKAIDSPMRMRLERDRKRLRMSPAR